MKSNEEIYRNLMIEYFKPSFPYSNIEEKVDVVLILKEEAQIVYKAMSQAVDQRNREINDWVEDKYHCDKYGQDVIYVDDLKQFLNI